MTRTDLARRIMKSAYLTGTFLLRSGKTSSFYFDKYRFESDPVLLTAIAEEMAGMVPQYVDRLAGLELGGIPLATALSLKCGKPCLFVRKEAKTYGTCNLAEGGFEPGDKILIIEDVITTAGQVCESVAALRQLGLEVSDVLCAIDRQQGGREKLAGIGCSLTPVFTLSELEAAADLPSS